MCIAIFKAPGKTLSKEILQRCFERNPHGAGFAFAKNRKLRMAKGFFKFENFWKNFNENQEGNAAIVHFRFASAGVIDKRNCHPWRIDDNHAMIHNGTLWDFIFENNEEEEDKNPNPMNLSDTGMFNHHVLRPMFRDFKGFHRTRYGNYLLQKAMDNRSKMIILNNEGKATIIREEAGEWFEGCWYSNDGYKEFSKYCGTLLPWQYELPLEYPDETKEKEIEA